MNDREQLGVDLATADQAMLGYLQTLLNEIPPLEAKTATEGEPQRQILAAETPVTAPAEIEQTVETALPVWAAGAFQALYFDTGGIRLAIPLVNMQTIARAESALTRVPGLPDWHLGVLRVRERNVAVVDLGRLLLPNRPAPHTTPGFVLMLDDGAWGLGCDSLGQASRMESGAVRWRRAAASPRYILGVHGETLVPILDVEEVLKHLRHTTRRRSSTGADGAKRIDHAKAKPFRAE